MTMKQPSFAVRALLLICCASFATKPVLAGDLDVHLSQHYKSYPLSFNELITTFPASIAGKDLSYSLLKDDLGDNSFMLVLDKERQDKVVDFFDKAYRFAAHLKMRGIAKANNLTSFDFIEYPNFREVFSHMDEGTGRAFGSLYVYKAPKDFKTTTKNLLVEQDVVELYEAYLHRAYEYLSKQQAASRTKASLLAALAVLGDVGLSGFDPLYNYEVEQFFDHPARIHAESAWAIKVAASYVKKVKEDRGENYQWENERSLITVYQQMVTTVLNEQGQIPDSALTIDANQGLFVDALVNDVSQHLVLAFGQSFVGTTCAIEKARTTQRGILKFVKEQLAPELFCELVTQVGQGSVSPSLIQKLSSAVSNAFNIETGDNTGLYGYRRDFNLLFDMSYPVAYSPVKTEDTVPFK